MIEIDVQKLERELGSGAPVTLISGNECREVEPGAATISGMSSAGLVTGAATAIFLGVMILGNASPPSTAPEFENLVLEIATPLNLRLAEAVGFPERYRELRERIENSGVPLLDDDELRQEIRDRKGIRG
jgi:hypothetical protein